MLCGWILANLGDRTSDVHQLLASRNRAVDESKRLAIVDADTDFEAHTIGACRIVHHPTNLQAEYFAREHAVLTHDVDSAVGDQRREVLMRNGYIAIRFVFSAVRFDEHVVRISPDGGGAGEIPRSPSNHFRVYVSNEMEMVDTMRLSPQMRNSKCVTLVLDCHDPTCAIGDDGWTDRARRFHDA